MGWPKRVYQQSLAIELELRSIPFQSKRELDVFYKQRQLATHYRPDFVVYESIVVELKAVTELLSEHEAQLFNYLRIARAPVGYLVNFGHKHDLQWKRLIVSSFHTPATSPAEILAPQS